MVLGDAVRSDRMSHRSSDSFPESIPRWNIIMRQITKCVCCTMVILRLRRCEALCPHRACLRTLPAMLIPTSDYCFWLLTVLADLPPRTSVL